MARDKRSASRVQPQLDESVVKGRQEARIIDLSVTGARVELGHQLRPDERCTVTVPTENGQLELAASVRRCRAAVVSRPDGSGQAVVYQAGLEFTGLDDGQREQLEEAIIDATLTATGNGDRDHRITIRVDSDRLELVPEDEG